MSEMNTSNASSKSKTHGRKFDWEKLAWHVGASVASGILSGIALGAGQAIFTTVAGSAGESSLPGNVIPMKKVL